MPSIASLAALQRAADEFPVTRLDLLIEPAARAAARESVEEAGLLLLGEVHGVRENPLLIRALLLAFGLEGLALEWHRDLAPVIGGFLAGQPLADHPLLWLGDGRITAGHLAVLRERTAAGPLALAMFDGTADAGWDWSRHDAAMAARVLSGAAAGTLVVAGNAHTPVRRTRLGVPMGAVLAQDRPGVREIRVRYGGGHFYNSTPRRIRRRLRPWRHRARLHLRGGTLLLDLPAATEAVVPQRPLPGPWRITGGPGPPPSAAGGAPTVAR
ncbi:MAG: hypothetical protein ACHP9Z_14650 [Streptosporangiales bacterium]